MKTNINTKLSLLIAIVAIVTVFMPVSAHAFQLERLIDPLCLFACPDEDPAVTYVTNTNSYNVSSNIESPGSSVSVVTTTNTNPAPAPATTVTTTATPASNYNYNYNYNTSSPAPVVAPVVAYNPAPVYTSYNSYNTYSQPYIYDTYGYNRYYTPPTYYQTPVYVQTYPAIQASCYANVGNTSVRIGDIVTWYASVSGGTGSYTYSWSGTDGLYGNGSSINKTYYNAGTKSAVLSVTSGNQTTSVNCNQSIYVYQPVTYYQNPIPVQIPVQYPIYTNSGLDIGCYADPSNAGINQPVNWTVEVTGGRAPYTYSWSGTDGLNGNQSSIIKFYNSYGTKSAIISVTSADGRTASRACSNTITIKKPVNTTTTTVAKPKPLTPCEQCALIQANNAQNQTQTANDKNQVSDNDSNDKSSSAFSLAYVPWGWVALLVIFVLFATVMYLLFNRPKI